MQKYYNTILNNIDRYLNNDPKTYLENINTDEMAFIMGVLGDKMFDDNLYWDEVIQDIREFVYNTTENKLIEVIHLMRTYFEKACYNGLIPLDEIMLKYNQIFNSDKYLHIIKSVHDEIYNDGDGEIFNYWLFESINLMNFQK